MKTHIVKQTNYQLHHNIMKRVSFLKKHEIAWDISMTKISYNLTKRQQKLNKLKNPKKFKDI